jgi:hypothetical protein
LEHPIWFPEIGPEIVHCISHISVSGIVPAVVPYIPELPAIVVELVVHCNFNTDVFSTRVYRTPHLLCQWSRLFRNNTTNFCISIVHTKPTFAVAVKLASTMNCSTSQWITKLS